MQELTVGYALALGLLQGITEWLPISSSGHLVIFQSLLGISVPPEFDIVIMAGTIAALLLYFRARILSLLAGLVKGDRQATRYCFFIVIAGIATALIGFAARPFFLSLYTRPFIVSLLLIVTGIFLFIASRPRVQDGEINRKSALVIGIAQGIAVAPGISRSGSTIGAALLLGIKPQEAAEFSFILGIPTMIAASAITFLDEPTGGVPPLLLIVAVVASFIAGYASIGIFMKVFRENHLDIFACYCIFAGSMFAILTFH
jgi:undecaprenyl-diphosphatase